METTRQNKISRLLQKELSDIFLAETRKTHGIIISVSVVIATPHTETIDMALMALCDFFENK